MAPADLVAFNTNIDSAIGLLLSALNGTGAIPAVNGVEVTATGGMGFTVGGTGQRLISQGRLLDVCPSTAFTLANGSSQDRIDILCVQATRPASSSTITRNVRADGLPQPVGGYSLTLAAGSGTFTIPSGLTGVVVVLTPMGAGTGQLSYEISGTTVGVTSSDSGDTRTVSAIVFAVVTGGSGTATTIDLLQNSPTWAVVQGTPGATPALPSAPSGYDIFAQFYVPAGATTLPTVGYDYPILPSLNTNFVCNALTVITNAIVDGSITGNGGTLSTTGPTGAWTFKPTIGHVGGGRIYNGANAAVIISWDDDGNLTCNNLTALDVIATGEFSGPGTGLTNIPQTALVSRNPIFTFGTTPANYTTGQNATIALPDDGHTYNVYVEFFLTGTNVTTEISSPTGGGTSDFVEVNGVGYSSGQVRASAIVVATGEGQTLSFPLIQTGGTYPYIGPGIWHATATLVS